MADFNQQKVLCIKQHILLLFVARDFIYVYSFVLEFCPVKQLTLK